MGGIKLRLSFSKWEALTLYIDSIYLTLDMNGDIKTIREALFGKIYPNGSAK